MGKFRQAREIVGAALDIKDVAGLIFRLFISVGPSAMITGGFSHYLGGISRQALVLYLLGLSLLFIAIIPKLPRLMRFMGVGAGKGEDLPIKLHTILLADGVELGVDGEKKTYTLSGIFNRILADEFPCRFSFVVFSRMDFLDPNRTNFKNRYAITNIDGSVIHCAPWVDISIAAGYDGQTFSGTLEDVEFQYPGTYFMCLELDDQGGPRVIGKVSFTVVRKQKAK